MGPAMKLRKVMSVLAGVCVLTVVGCSADAESTGSSEQDIAQAEFASTLPLDCTSTNVAVYQANGIAGFGNVNCETFYGFRLHVQLNKRAVGSSTWERAVFEYGFNEMSDRVSIATITGYVPCEVGIEYQAQTTVFRPGVWSPTHYLQTGAIQCPVSAPNGSVTDPTP